MTGAGGVTYTYHPCARCSPATCSGHVGEPLPSEPRVWMPAPSVRPDWLTMPPTPHLSNAELAEAIEWTRDALAHLGETEKEFAPTLAHYEALLAEQRRRAEAAP